MTFCRDKLMRYMTVFLVLCFQLLFSQLLSAEWKLNKARKAQVKQFFNELACNDCHGGAAKIPIRAARYQYNLSKHNSGGHAFYSNSGVCIRCHTHEGFIEYIETKKIDSKKQIPYPSQPGCFTCHAPHTRGDLSVRTSAPVKLVSGKTFDRGSGNLCANCHSSLSKAKDLVKAIPAKNVPADWGAHHGPQADMLLGTNGYEYSGKKYYNSAHSTQVKDGCISCHMKFPEGRFSLSPGMAGHSFKISGEVDHATKLNTAGCLGSCHKKMKQATYNNRKTPKNGFWWHQSSAIYSKKAPADFDHDGVRESVQAEVEGLLNFFVNKRGTGYLQKGRKPMYKKDGTWNKIIFRAKRSKKQMAALYNYKFVLEDRSRGVHNAPYAVQLLYDSLKSLNPKFNTSKRNAFKRPK